MDILKNGIFEKSQKITKRFLSGNPAKIAKIANALKAKIANALKAKLLKSSEDFRCGLKTFVAV